MSHDIEIRDNGAASFVGAREAAWHRLGTVYEDQDGITVAAVLADLDCGYVTATDSVQGVILTDDGVTTLTDPTRKMTVRVRSTGAVPLGVVGQNYKIVQEAEAFGFVDAIVDSDEALVSSAGLLDGGRRAFCCLKLPRNVMIGGVDAVDLYLFIVTSHDGTLATTAAVTPIRVVCQNTVQAGLRTAVSAWKVRHTKNATMKIAEARRALDLTFKFEEAWAFEAEALLARKITKRDYEAVARTLFPAPAADAKPQSKTSHDKVWDTLMKLWTSDTQDGIKGTAWGAYNAFVEFGDWFRGTRGADDAIAQQFLTSLTSGHGTVGTLATYKDRALTLVKARAGMK